MPSCDPAPKGCAHAAGCHTGEGPLLASATVGARHWLLIEHPGPWAARVEECRLPGHIREAVHRAAALGVRVQLIRRPGRRRPAPAAGPVRVFVGRSTGPRPWLARGFFHDLSDLDLDSLARGALPASCILEDEPVFLVCTHAKRNACCGRLGLPVARALAAALTASGHPDRVWETTHVGGDRYAANLVCLPHGLYYGSMSQAAAIAAANAYRHGEIVLDRFRGRAGIPEPLQAAEHFVRVHTGERSVGGVAVESFRSDGDVTEAVVRRGDIRYQVVVEPTVFLPPCPAAGEDVCAGDSFTTYRLVALRALQYTLT